MAYRADNCDIIKRSHYIILHVLIGGKVISVFAACAGGSKFETPVGSVADTA